jgi:uncharacterized protein (DUF2062 family)
MRKILAKFKKFFLIDDSPAKIAGGAAVGLFMGIVPGEGVISTLVVTTILRLNRLAGTIGILFFNMWTTLLFLPLAAFVGSVLFHIQPGALIADFKFNYNTSFKNFFEYSIIFKLLIPLMVGYVISALIISLLFFFLLYFLLKYKKIKFR